MRKLLVPAILIVAALSASAQNYQDARRRMVATQIAARGIKDHRVLDAMLSVERHLFLPEDLRDSAYEDHPIPIGEGQTISQPYIVALMSEAACAPSVIQPISTNSWTALPRSAAARRRGQ